MPRASWLSALLGVPRPMIVLTLMSVGSSVHALAAREQGWQMEAHERVDDGDLVVKEDSGNRARENCLVIRGHRVVEVGKRT